MSCSFPALIHSGRAFEHAERIAGQCTLVVGEDVDDAERRAAMIECEVCTIAGSIHPTARSAPSELPAAQAARPQ